MSRLYWRDLWWRIRRTILHPVEWRDARRYNCTYGAKSYNPKVMAALREAAANSSATYQRPIRPAGSSDE